MTALHVHIEHMTADLLEGRCTQWDVFPQPGHYIAFLTTSGTSFYTQIQAVSPLLECPQVVKLQLKLVSGNLDIQIQQAQQLSPEAFFKARFEGTKAAVPFSLADITVDLDRSGHVVYLQPAPSGVHQAVIQHFKQAGFPLLVVDPVGLDFKGLLLQEIRIGKDLALSIPAIGINTFVAWVTAQLPQSVQGQCNTFLLSTIPTTGDFFGLQDLINHPGMKSFPYAAILLEVLQGLVKSRCFADNAEQALIFQPDITNLHLNLSLLPPQNLALAYQGILRMALQQVFPKTTQFVLVAPEVAPAATQVFLQQMPYRVFLMSQTTDPWQTMATDSWTLLSDSVEPCLQIQGKMTQGLTLCLPITPTATLKSATMQSEQVLLDKDETLMDTASQETEPVAEDTVVSDMLAEIDDQESTALLESLLFPSGTASQTELTYPTPTESQAPPTADAQTVIPDFDEEAPAVPDTDDLSEASLLGKFEMAFMESPHLPEAEASLSLDDTLTINPAGIQPAEDKIPMLPEEAALPQVPSLEDLNMPEISQDVLDATHNFSVDLRYALHHQENDEDAAAEPSEETVSAKSAFSTPVQSVFPKIEDLSARAAEPSSDPAMTEADSRLEALLKDLDEITDDSDWLSTEETMSPPVPAANFPMETSDTGQVEPLASALPDVPGFEEQPVTSLPEDAAGLPSGLSDNIVPLDAGVLIDESEPPKATFTIEAETPPLDANVPELHQKPGELDLSLLEELEASFAAKQPIPAMPATDTSSPEHQVSLQAPANTAEIPFAIDLSLDLGEDETAHPPSDKAQPVQSDVLAEWVDFDLGLESFSDTVDETAETTQPGLSDALASSDRFSEQPPGTLTETISANQAIETTPDLPELEFLFTQDPTLYPEASETQADLEAEMLVPDFSTPFAEEAHQLALGNDISSEQSNLEGTPLPVYKSAISPVETVFHAGDEVMHKRYGHGVVKRVITMDDQYVILNVYFDSVGKRLLDPRLTQLECIAQANR